MSAASEAKQVQVLTLGYDVCLLGQFYAFPQFNERFGSLNRKGEYEVTAPWQAGLSNGAAVGEIFGLFINGYVSERFGYRKTVAISLIWLTAFIFLFVFAKNIVYLQVAEILCGECERQQRAAAS